MGENNVEGVEVIMDELGESREIGCEIEVKKEEEGEVKWEEFMPRMMIRVLLVEADDSTRQLLTALLRKCNYKVAAIPDGLQAWEILKKRHNCIDLVLTELDLPSISGYALLTLIMEHDGCKNIPVIMMSSQDSISMVLKCILKGSADFLIKPVRKNELKNLWRHVWRRLAVNDGQDPQNIAKVEAAFENSPATNNSGDNVSTSRKSSGKATDEEDFSWMKSREENKETENNLKNVKMEKEFPLLAHVVEEKEARSESGSQSNNEGNNSVALIEDEEGSCTGLATEEENSGQENHKRKDNADDLKSSQGAIAIDLIGSMKKQKCIVAQPSYNNGDFSNLNSSPELELSLRRVHDSETKEVDERHTLITHSNASAFSRYNSNKKSRTNELTDTKVIADSSPCNETIEAIQDDKSIAGQPIFSLLESPSPTPSRDVSVKNPNSAIQKEEPPFVTSPPLHSDPGTLSSTLNNSPEDEFRNDCSQTVDPSCSSTTGNDVAEQKKISGSGSTSDVTEVNANGPNIKEVKKDNDCSKTFELDQLKQKTGFNTAQREAALAKFRLKRKGRCFEKKLRYQSRKTLAEQRQRMKGQFVRHVPADQMLTPDGKTSIPGFEIRRGKQEKATERIRFCKLVCVFFT